MVESNQFTDAYIPNWNAIEALSLQESPQLVKDRELHCKTSAGVLCIRFYEFGIRLTSLPERKHDYGLLMTRPTPEAISVTDLNGRTLVKSPRLELVIEQRPFTFELRDNQGHLIQRSSTDGHFVRRHRVPPFAKINKGWLVGLELNSAEAVYGLGEKWGALNKRGQWLRSYNCDALGVNAEVSYKNTPFCWSPEGWGIMVHTPAPVIHSVGFPPWSQRSYQILLEDKYLDLFIFCAFTREPGLEIIARYTALTGRATLPPRWSGGVILSKAYYRDADEILSVAREVRARRMPCDVITFDGRAWQDTDTRFAFEWCPRRYPDPASIMRELKALNFKVCVWEYPLISVKHPWFNEFSAKGWLLKDRRTGKAYRYDWDQQAFGPVLTALPQSGIVDFTHPQAYAFWRDAHKSLFDLGVDMIKADFGEQVEDDNMVAHSGDSGFALHNVYAHLYNRCVFEAAEKYSHSGAFLFSRSAWIGSQRFSSQWGGDPQADWEGMIGNIRGGLSWGLSGAPFYATDIGGFYKDTRNDALYVRWAQAGVFSAHMRFHGIGPREPWTYSEAACAAVLKALRWRYRLQIYLRETMRQACRTGLPVQRPMVLAFAAEPETWHFENQFMFGDDLLVAPCFHPDGEVSFYLPAGDWVRFDLDHLQQSRQSFPGKNSYRLTLALDEMAVFARFGTAIPLAEAVEFTDQFGKAIDVVATWTA